jgi:mRNA interferase MazF
VAGAWAPERGDVVWLEFNPQSGREQAGHRPGLVLSPRSYNRKAGLALVCPITSQVKGYPFEVALPQGPDLRGVVLADQIKCLDWRARHARRIASVPAAVVDEALAKLETLVGRAPASP